MPYSESELAARWQRLTAPFVLDVGLREGQFQALAAAYQAPSRHYHTLQHVDNLLKRLDATVLQDAPVVELAVWFHDAVYNAFKSDNEARSAALALGFKRQRWRLPGSSAWPFSLSGPTTTPSRSRSKISTYFVSWTPT